MTGKPPESENIPCFLNKKIFWEKSLFFSCNFDIFLWQHWMRNKISCRRDIFFALSLLDQKLSVFCQKVAKVEHTICDCN